MGATGCGRAYGKCRGVQTPNDTRKQNASRAYRQQHRQIVPSATARMLHTNTVRLYSALVLNRAFSLSFLKPRRLRLLAEPTSHRTYTSEECVCRLEFAVRVHNLFALPVHVRVYFSLIFARVKSTVFDPCRVTTTFLPPSRGRYVHRNSDWISTRVQSGWLTFPSGKCSQTANYSTRMVLL